MWLFDAREDVLASYKGNYPGKISYCSTALIPHLEEKICSKCVNLEEVEKERLEDRRSRICKAVHYQDTIGVASTGIHASRSQYPPVL